MKTYISAIERRVHIRPNTYFGILNYDIDNAYPQRVLEFVRQSPTAKNCWGKRAKFLHGNGFEVPKLGDQVINDRGLTLAKLLKAITTDKGLFPGFGIHVNYNANYKITDHSFVKFEDIRQGDTDESRFRGKYIIYKDWGRRTWKSIQPSKLQVIDPFDPNPDVIRAQVIAAGGWDNYNGQLFYLTPAVDDYELCLFDAALEDTESEAGIKIFNNRQITTGFMPSTVITMNTRREAADNEPNIDEMTGLADTGPSQLEKDLGAFQGAKEAQKILVLEYDGEIDQVPQITPFPIQNNDKLFEVTEKSVEARIIKGFEVPKELVSSSDKNGLNASGAEKREAIREFNDNTSGERMEISEALAKVFAPEICVTNYNPKGNWNIIEVTSEGCGTDIIKITPAIQAILESEILTAERKINILVVIHGIKRGDAETIVPTDEEMKAAIAAGAKTNSKQLRVDEPEAAGSQKQEGA